MDKLFFSGALKGFIQTRALVTDGTIFRLHYRVTALMLSAFSLLVSATQFIGEPIQCLQRDDIPKKMLNTFCWAEGTFTLPKALNKKVGEEVVYPGVDHRDPEDDLVVHAYYQWVCFMLILQATLFYFPRLIWVSWEGDRIKSLLQELNVPVIPEEERKKRVCNLVRYFRFSMHHHSVYAFKYLLCELITLVNVIGQIYFTDVFLGGEFTTYGIEVVKFASSIQEDRTDPMVRVFPRMAKCTFHRYGSSGDVQKYDALCLLPLNIINEKIYIALWFWFIVLSLLTTLAITYRVILLLWPGMRYYALRPWTRLTPPEHMKTILLKTCYGDWFVLFLLAKNMEILHYRDFLLELLRDLDVPLIDDTSESSA